MANGSHFSKLHLIFSQWPWTLIPRDCGPESRNRFCRRQQMKDTRCSLPMDSGSHILQTNREYLKSTYVRSRTKEENGKSRMAVGRTPSGRAPVRDCFSAPWMV